jgi:hypothetical protein
MRKDSRRPFILRTSVLPARSRATASAALSKKDGPRTGERPVVMPPDQQGGPNSAGQALIFRYAGSYQATLRRRHEARARAPNDDRHG